jgi:hypothetical protein
MLRMRSSFCPLRAHSETGCEWCFLLHKAGKSERDSDVIAAPRKGTHYAKFQLVSTVVPLCNRIVRLLNRSTQAGCEARLQDEDEYQTATLWWRSGWADANRALRLGAAKAAYRAR